MEDSDGTPPLVQRQETVHPLEVPLAYPDVGGRGDYPPEPSVRNVEVWLDWQACQLDMPHWWVELAAIPNVGNPKRLAQKMCTSFLIPSVRCETLPGQEYTVPPAPKCLTRNMLLPNDPSYQDVWHQPLLLTMAYARALQYWVEKFRLPVHPDYCPLVMSIVELMQVVKEHIIFYTWDVLQGLGRIVPETVDWDLAVPPGHPVIQSTTTDIGGSAKAWGHMVPLPHCSDLHLRPHQSNLLPHLLQMMLGIHHLALQTLCWSKMPQSFQLNPKWRTGQLVKTLALLRP